MKYSNDVKNVFPSCLVELNKELCLVILDLSDYFLTLNQRILPKIMSKITSYILIKNKCVGVNDTILLFVFILFRSYNLKILKCKHRIHSFWIVMWSESFVL